MIKSINRFFSNNWLKRCDDDIDWDAYFDLESRRLRKIYPASFIDAPETSKAVLFPAVIRYLQSPFLVRLMLFGRAMRYLRLLMRIIHSNREANLDSDGHWHEVALKYQNIIETLARKEHHP